MTRVKVCGLRRYEEVVAAAEGGADYVGMVFVSGSRRQLAEAEAGRIITAFRKMKGGGGPKVVGLFADQPVELVNDTALALGLDLLQLCGDETLDYCDSMKRPVIKVLHVRAALPRAQVLEELHSHMSALEARGHLGLLDAYQEGALGGTGSTFDWSIARELAQRGHQFLLAGGLTPQNVGQAIGTVRPYGVDVSSGVETYGAKDVAKIRAFLEAARRAGQERPTPSRGPFQGPISFKDGV